MPLRVRCVQQKPGLIDEKTVHQIREHRVTQNKHLEWTGQPLSAGPA
jgi:hypothetical protein